MRSRIYVLIYFLFCLAFMNKYASPMNINLNGVIGHFKNVFEKVAIEPTLRTFPGADKTIDHFKNLFGKTVDLEQIKHTLSNFFGSDMAIGRVKDLFGKIAAIDLEHTIRDFPIEISMNKAIEHLNGLYEKTSAIDLESIMNTFPVDFDTNKAVGQIRESLDDMFDKAMDLYLRDEAYGERGVQRKQLKSLIDEITSSIIEAIHDHPELIYATAALGIGLLVTPAALPLAANAAGFGSGGISAGSAAASFMASYGGTVSVGSICAILQSIGATGTIGSVTTSGFIAEGLTAVVAAVLMDHISRMDEHK